MIIGRIVITLVAAPVVLLIGAFIFDKPRNFRVPALFLSSIALQIVVVAGFLAGFGLLLGYLIPQ
jgi:hypothetical protein